MKIIAVIGCSRDRFIEWAYKLINKENLPSFFNSADDTAVIDGKKYIQFSTAEEMQGFIFDDYFIFIEGGFSCDLKKLVEEAKNRIKK